MSWDSNPQPALNKSRFVPASRSASHVAFAGVKGQLMQLSQTGTGSSTEVVILLLRLFLLQALAAHTSLTCEEHSASLNTSCGQRGHSKFSAKQNKTRIFFSF